MSATPGPVDSESVVRKIGRSIRRVATDENVDLYCLAVAALAFTILGALQIVDMTVLSSVIMGALAILAVSQIRSRNQVARLERQGRSDPLALLRTTFPEDLRGRACAAGEYLFIGRSMGRTSLNEQHALRSILRSGGTVRIAVMDPTDAPLMEVAGRDKHGSFRSVESRIRQTLENLESLRESEVDHIEVRVLRVLPPIGITGVDLSEDNGVLWVQSYEFRPHSEPAPIMQFASHDHQWYRHFVAEAERLWESARYWPLGAATGTDQRTPPRSISEPSLDAGEALPSVLDDPRRERDS